MAVEVECRQLVKRFGEFEVLHELTWRVAAGSVAGLLGPSGAGKTTLLRILAGLDPPTSGSVLLKNGTPRVGQVGMVFQNLALWPHLNARQHVEYVLHTLPSSKRRAEAERLLQETRLPSTAWDRRPADLSGGEGQRLALARALAPQPELLLLDEPLAHVDSALRQELLELLKLISTQHEMTMIFVTHSLPEAQQICDTISILESGRMLINSDEKLC